jgi:hypothetical protein
MVETTLRAVTVSVVRGAHGPRYQVATAGESVPSLLTAGVGPQAWQQVEQQVRHAMGMATPLERMANALHAIVEQHGVESPAGQQAYAALVEAGLD